MFTNVIFFYLQIAVAVVMEDSDMRVCKVFLVLDLQIRTQREGGWHTHRLLALTSYVSAKFCLDLQEME